MISGEYNAEQAYQSFNSQLLEEKSTSEDIVLDSKKLIPIVSIPAEAMKPILLWQTLCAVFMGRMC